MRGLLNRLGVRGSLVTGLLVLVLVIVAVARLAGRNDEASRYSTDVPVTASVDPTLGDDAEVVASPTVYPDDAAVRAAAKSFIAAWLKRDLSPSAWHAGLARFATEALAKNLDGVDPLQVPANRTVADPTIVSRTELFAQTSTALDTGTILLNLTRQGDRWLAESIDWDPS